MSRPEYSGRRYTGALSAEPASRKVADDGLVVDVHSIKAAKRVVLALESGIGTQCAVSVCVGEANQA